MGVFASKIKFFKKSPKPYYIDLTINEGNIFEEKNFGPMGPPGVPRVPISSPNLGIFSKLNGPGPLGSGGHSHTIFSNGRFQGAQRSFGGDVRPYNNRTTNRCVFELPE